MKRRLEAGDKKRQLMGNHRGERRPKAPEVSW